MRLTVLPPMSNVPALMRSSEGGPRGPLTCASRAGCPESRDLVHVDGDVLGLQVLVDALVAAFATDTRVLDAPERGPGVGYEPLVETDHSRLQRLAHADATLEVVRVDVGHETELGGVGVADRVLL